MLMIMILDNKSLKFNTFVYKTMTVNLILLNWSLAFLLTKI